MEETLPLTELPPQHQYQQQQQQQAESLHGSESEEGEIEEAPPRVVVKPKPKPRPSKAKKENKARETRRSAGAVAAYIPPAKRRKLLEQQQQSGEGSAAAALLLRQQETWIEEQRAIHGTINRLNATTIKPLIQELFQKVNLIRMRGVLCKSTLTAALSSPKYSNVYAALISVINSKLPEVGELVVARAILSFRRHYQRREKGQCQAVCVFLAHLFHQAVVHELLILQLLSVLLDGDPTDDSVEVAVELLQTTGQALLEVSPAGVRACLERLRALLHEGQLNKRVEYKMEQLLKLRKTGFRDFPPITDELDLVERDDQITH
jgi:pre-mRNA-splicing factor CWC22